MNFSVKIFLTYICIYLLVITAVGFTVTENSYQRMKEQEIHRGSLEAGNIRSNIVLYLMNSRLGHSNYNEAADYGESIVDLFSGSSTYLEVFDGELNLVATNSPAIINVEREELLAANNGQRSVILRHDDLGNYYLFVSFGVELDNQRLLISMIKDISHLDGQRKDEYIFFLEVALVGLLVVAVVVGVITRILMKPIKELNKAAQDIAAGNYAQRVAITTNDEVGNLALQFNLMAAEVQGRIQQLQEETYRQQRFVGNLTHELRTPLTSIIGYADLLQKMKYEPELFQKSLGYIYNEGKRMLNLNKMLMDLTYYREGELEFERYSMLKICQKARDVVQNRADEKKIAIEIVGEDFYLDMAVDLMKSVLINLLDNSLKASDEKTSIVITLSVNDENYQVAVKDQGKGMKPEELERITEPFYRVDKARARQDGGLGLGVAICSQIINRHQGQLLYDSQLGVGTTAYLYFPINNLSLFDDVNEN